MEIPVFIDTSKAHDQPSKLGRVPIFDDRDSKYLVRSVAPVVTEGPLNVTFYSPMMFESLDQDETPHCVGATTEGWQKAFQVLNRFGPDMHTIYRGCKFYDPWKGAGTNARYAMMYMKQLGYIIEFRWLETVEEIARYIQEKQGTVLFGSWWYRSMWTPNKKGFIKDISGVRDGGHEYLIYGYNHKLGAFRCRNSWGKPFGENGNFWLLGEQLHKLKIEDGDAVVAQEIKLKVQPSFALAA